MPLNLRYSKMPAMEKSMKERYSDLLEVIRIMTLNLETDKVLDYIAESVAKLAQARDSSLILIDDETNQFYFRAVYGQNSDKIKYVNFDINKGIAGWVVKERKPLLVEDVATDARFNKSVDIKTGFKTKSIICVPLEIKGKIIGVLEALNSENEKAFTNEQFELLLAFSRQAAIAIDNSKLYTEAINENVYLHKELDERYRIISSSKRLNDVLETARNAAASDSTILITGESGTGKELVARDIHNYSPRCRKPFVVVNCASLSEELLESELFGHEKGAFTGAHIAKLGKLAIADKGTTFLDEIGELKLPLQAKLLRVLQEQTFERVGGTETINADIRFICATNRDLMAMVEAGEFRSDLYYRLNVIPITMPPLRERREEIPDLARFFINRYCIKTGQKVKTISEKSLLGLMEYRWPGNVRELENIIERSVVLERTGEIHPQKFLPETKNAPADTPETLNDEEPESKGYRDLVKDKKKEIIMSVLASVNGNQSRAAKLLKVQPSYLSRLIGELDIKNIRAF